jgi:hypothetical protein
MQDVTAEQVKQAVLTTGISYIEHHNCSLCGHMTCYIVQDEQLYFDPNCNCTSRWVPREPVSWQDAAMQVNMQSNLEWKIKWAERFGIGKSLNVGTIPP